MYEEVLHRPQLWERASSDYDANQMARPIERDDWAAWKPSGPAGIAIDTMASDNISHYGALNWTRRFDELLFTGIVNWVALQIQEYKKKCLWNKPERSILCRRHPRKLEAAPRQSRHALVVARPSPNSYPGKPISIHRVCRCKNKVLSDHWWPCSLEHNDSLWSPNHFARLLRRNEHLGPPCTPSIQKIRKS